MFNKEKSLFNKITILEEIQSKFNSIIKEDMLRINGQVESFIDNNKYNLTEEQLEIIKKDVFSNLVELELNIETIVANFSIVTGINIERHGSIEIKKKNRFRKIQLLFLLNEDVSLSYSKMLEYLRLEIVSKVEELQELLILILEKIKLKENIDEELSYLKDEYLDVDSDLGLTIEKTIGVIEKVHDGITDSKNKNINLGFLLISAFLSVILFFPEFNNMLNLRYSEITYEEKINQIMYEKATEQLSMNDLINIKDNTITDEMRSRINIERTKEIIKANMEEENKDLEREQNRISIFINILCLILIPYLIWIIFIAL